MFPVHQLHNESSSLITAFRRRPILTLAVLSFIGLAISYGFGTLAARPATSKVPMLAANEQRFTLTASDGIKTAAS